MLEGRGGAMATYEIPDGLPILSRGKHRTARKGACFMEMASLLANEPWSDHPKCTHPVLAHLARMVNDHTTDRHRGDLVTLIPSVVGLRGGGLPWVVDLTATVALRALPDVPSSSQRALVAGLLRCDELATRLGPGTVVSAGAIRRALDDRPETVGWARRFAGGTTISDKQFERRSAPCVMQCAVGGLVTSAVSPDEADARLCGLLRTGIETARRLEPVPVRSRSVSHQVVLEGERRGGRA
jgi:hypothetical protein